MPETGSLETASSSVMSSISLGFQVVSPSKIFTFGNNNITDTTNVGTLTLLAQQ